MKPVFVGLGANIGDAAKTLRTAVEILESLDVLHNIRCSSFRTTQPVGDVAQPNYVNAALIGESHWHPECILSLLHTIEAQLGRNRAQEVRWGPRPIDMDLLMVGNIILNSPSIQLPHPEMTQRQFVLEPLAELAPNAIHPTSGKTIGKLLEDVQ